MSWQALVMYGIVAGVGIPAAFRNTTALAMVIAWLFVELVYQTTGNSLPLKFSFMADIAVITAVLAKATIREGCATYSTLRLQAQSMWRAITVCDRFIIGLYLLGCWPLYLAPVHPYYQWLALWAITIVQFMLVGAEALLDWRKSRRNFTAKSESSNVLHFAPAYARKFIGAEPIPTRSDTQLPLVGIGGDG